MLGGLPRKVAFVEPQDDVLPELRRQVSRAWGDARFEGSSVEAARIVHTAICPGGSVTPGISIDEGGDRGNITMYRFSERIARDFPGRAAQCVLNLSSVIFSARTDW